MIEWAAGRCDTTRGLQAHTYWWPIPLRTKLEVHEFDAMRGEYVIQSEVSVSREAKVIAGPFDNLDAAKAALVLLVSVIEAEDCDDDD